MKSRCFALTVPLAMFLGLTLCGCSSEDDNTTTTDATLDVEEHVVYRDILAQKYPASSYVIRAETDADATPGSSTELDALLSSVASNCPTLSADTASSYRARNDAAHTVPTNMSLASPYVTVTSEQLNQIFSSNGGWETFRAQYPNASGIITLSRVGFNAKPDQALVYVGHTLDYLAGEGMVYVMRKEGSAWLVTCQSPTWIS
jgi:hypothetical protein